MDAMRARIAAKKAELDRLREAAPGSLANLEHVQDLELTYTSNAIEGNTLSAAETALVIEHGITIGGVVQRSLPAIAGAYADQGRFVVTDSGRQAFPSPAVVPALMGDFACWLQAAAMTPETAFTAHRRLVEIHPFNDGNGRTARLLMNLILIRGGYPPVAVRPVDRPAYIGALQEARAGGPQVFERLLYERLETTLDEYLAVSREALAARARLPKPEGDEPDR